MWFVLCWVCVLFLVSLFSTGKKGEKKGKKQNKLRTVVFDLCFSLNKIVLLCEMICLAAFDCYLYVVVVVVFPG